MKYLIISKNPTTGVLEWNIVDNKNNVSKVIKNYYGSIIRQCNYDRKEVKKYILIFEIEPNYEFIDLEITKPVEFTVELIG